MLFKRMGYALTRITALSVPTLPWSRPTVWAVHKHEAGIDRGSTCLHSEIGLIWTHIQ